MNTITIKRYQSFDGAIFDSEEEAYDHENELKKQYANDYKLTSLHELARYGNDIDVSTFARAVRRVLEEINPKDCPNINAMAPRMVMEMLIEELKGME